MRRLPLLPRIAAPVVLGLLLLHGAGWWWLSRQVRDGFATWAAAQHALGHTVAAGTPSLTGWPLAAGISVPDMVVEGAGWRWAAERTALTLQPWALDRLRIEPSGQRTLSVGTVPLAIQSGSVLITLSLPAGDNPAVQADAPVLTTPWGPVSADHVAGQLPFDGNTTRLTLRINNLSLPPGPPYLLGPSVAELALQLATKGAVPPPRAADLATWRDGGGTVAVDSVRLRWGPLTMDAAGTASLDRTLQPLADLRVALSGQEHALDAAVAQGLLQPRAAVAVKAVLGLLAGARQDGQPAVIPASLRDGTVALAGFPVARVPPVTWPP